MALADTQRDRARGLTSGRLELSPVSTPAAPAAGGAAAVLQSVSSGCRVYPGSQGVARDAHLGKHQPTPWGTRYMGLITLRLSPAGL